MTVPVFWNVVLLIVTGCILLASSSCTRPSKPADPGLAADQLGTGIILGMDAAEARSAAVSKVGLKVLVLTRDELVNRAPFSDKPAEGDLVFALYNELQPDGSTAAGGIINGRINELRCFLGSTADSQVTVLGHPVAGLSPAGMEQIFGHADELVVSSDGNTHLRYEFAFEEGGDKDLSGLAIRLVTSHNPDGNCFAMLLSLMPEL